jgi:hypothetical protein
MLRFKEVWALDFEFQALPGERPRVVCLVAHNVQNGQRLRLWADELGSKPPFRTDDEALFVAYFASAEMGCFKSLSWPMPRMVLDLFCEFRARTNGRPLPAGNALLGAMTYFGLRHIAPEEKQALRDRINAGPPWSEEDKVAILDYCASDVDALLALLPAMMPAIAPTPQRLGQALLRGRYMCAVAAMEHAGVPIDVELLDRFRAHWNEIKLTLIREVDCKYDVFDGETLRLAKLEAMTHRMGIAWPRTPCGRLSISEDTFRDMARIHPQLMDLRELVSTLGQTRLFDIPVGSDRRNRTLLSPFRAITGRNQPSSSKFIFGPATWMRSLIKPEAGQSLAYLDWASQEVAIAAVLSGDEALLKVVREGDPYLGFARLAGLAPADATSQSHGAVRDLCKILFLAIGYGMGVETLALHLNRGVHEAGRLLRLYRETFPARMDWAQRVCDHGMLGGQLETVFGWPFRAEKDVKPTTLRNWPVQAHGAEVLRLSCCLATEVGIKVCCPVHDALLIEAESDKLGTAIDRAIECMNEASRIVLGGLQVKVDSKIVKYPDRYHDKRGKRLFERVSRLSEEISSRKTA